MESDSGEEDYRGISEYKMDSTFSLGGGSANFSFPPTTTTNSSNLNELPSQPVSYDDFEYPTSIPSFEFDLFPTSSSTSQFFANPFSPAAATPPFIMEQTQLHIVPPILPYPEPSLFSPPPIASTSNSNPNSLSNSMIKPSPLFDETESALFSSFLNTIDVDQNFLFNPVLPPGMPSPPSTIYPMREEERRERERLGEGVNGLDIGFGYNSNVNVYNNDGMNGTYQVKDEEEPESNWNRSRRTRGGREESSRDDQLRNVGSGKKLKVSETQDWERERESGEALDTEDEEDDVEMNSSNYIEPSRTSNRSNAGRRRNSRNTLTSSITPSTSSLTSTSRPRKSSTNARQIPTTTTSLPIQSTSTKPIRNNTRKELPASPPRNRSESPSQSPEDSTNQSKKTPLTDSQKRSNHILSEQRRRNAIRSGFKDLFDLLSNGETASGIVVVPNIESDDGKVEGNVKKKKPKGSGRGRGRKGEVGAGASKSVVLEKASEYIKWLERGNKALEQEVDRVESFL